MGTVPRGRKQSPWNFADAEGLWPRVPGGLRWEWPRTNRGALLAICAYAGHAPTFLPATCSMTPPSKTPRPSAPVELALALGVFACAWSLAAWASRGLYVWPGVALGLCALLAAGRSQAARVWRGLAALLAISAVVLSLLKTGLQIALYAQGQ